MSRSDKPPPDQACVWLLVEPHPRSGHRLAVGAYSSCHAAQEARTQWPHMLALCCVPLDQAPQKVR